MTSAVLQARSSNQATDFQMGQLLIYLLTHHIVTLLLIEFAHFILHIFGQLY